MPLQVDRAVPPLSSSSDSMSASSAGQAFEQARHTATSSDDGMAQLKLMDERSARRRKLLRSMSRGRIEQSALVGLVQQGQEQVSMVSSFL